MILTINNIQIPYVEDFSFVTSRYGNTEICVKFMPEHKFTVDDWLKILDILGAGNYMYKGVNMWCFPDTCEENWRAKLNTEILRAKTWCDEHIEVPRTDILGVIDNDVKIFVYDELDDDCCYIRYWGEE